MAGELDLSWMTASIISRLRINRKEIQTRPTVIFLAIISLCICSVLSSLYYLHNIRLASPLDLMKSHGSYPQKISQVIGDDIREESLLPSQAVNGNLPILNNIDIAQHIETKKSQLFHVDQKPLAHPETQKEVKHRQSKSKVKTVVPHKALRKEDMWPSHEKAHKKKRHNPSFVQLYNKPNRTRTDWNGEKYIVYLCNGNLTCAGWGDRQHGILSVYLLSLFTNRTFKVDMRSPCTLTKLYHPRILNWKINETEFEGLSSTQIYALNDREFREAMKEINFNDEYPQDVVYLTTNYDYFYSLKANPYYKDLFRRKVKNRPRPIIFADLWQGIFKMNKRVVRRFTHALSNAWPTKQHKLVCSHIRFGRNPSIPSDGDIRNTLSTIKPFWEFIKKHSNPDKYRLFVASDWQEFREKVNLQYKDIAVDVEGDIIHIDKLRHSRKDNQTSVEQVDACSGFEKVIADQHVLSKCDILLLTYSVFGKAAAYLRRSNENLYLMDKGSIKTLMLFNDNYLH